jgi:hypothetical protein
MKMENKHIIIYIESILLSLLFISCQKKDIKSYFFCEKKYKIWKKEGGGLYYIYYSDGRLDIARSRVDSSFITYNIRDEDSISISDPKNKWFIKNDTLFEGLDTFFPTYSNHLLYFRNDDKPYYDFTDCIDLNGKYLSSKSRLNSKGFDMEFEDEYKIHLKWYKDTLSREMFNLKFVNHPILLPKTKIEIYDDNCMLKLIRLEKKYNISTIECPD